MFKTDLKHFLTSQGYIEGAASSKAANSVAGTANLTEIENGNQKLPAVQKKACPEVEPSLDIILPHHVYRFPTANGTERLGIKVNLPSGVDHADVTYRILEPGVAIELLIQDTDEFSDGSFEDQIYSGLSRDHARFVAFKNHVKQLIEKNDLKNGRIIRKMIINLPFQVEMYFYKDANCVGDEIIGDDKHTWLIMDLIGVQNNYKQAKKKSKFRRLGGGNPPNPPNDHHRNHDGRGTNNRSNDRGGNTANQGTSFGRGRIVGGANSTEQDVSSIELSVSTKCDTDTTTDGGVKKKADEKKEDEITPKTNNTQMFQKDVSSEKPTSLVIALTHQIPGKNNKRALEVNPSTPNSFQSLLTQKSEKKYSSSNFDFGIECPNASAAMQIFHRDSPSPLVTPKKIKLTKHADDVEMGEVEMGEDTSSWMNVSDSVC